MVRGRLALLIHQVGLVVIVGGFAQLHARLLAPELYQVLSSPRLPWTGLFLGLLCVASYSVGLPDLQRTRLEALATAVGASLASVVGVSLLQGLLGMPLLPRSVVGLTALVVPLWSLIQWNLSQDLDRRSASRDRVFLISHQEDTAALRAELRRAPERPARIVGHMDLAQAGLVAGPGGDRGESIVEMIRAPNPTVLVLDGAAQADPAIVGAASTLHQQGMRVRTLSLFYEEWLGKIPVSELEKVAMLFDIGEVHRDRYARIKRLIDVVVATPGLLVLAPVAAVLMVLNPLFNRGPLLFRQERVGKGGEVFDTLKFRSMIPVADADPSHAVWTAEADPRVTPMGRWMRRTHLDELPQLLNIVRGELTLVGPRPEQPHYVEELRTKLPYYDARTLVRPGLTGWAQVKFGYAASDSDALEKLQYDLFYLRRQNLALDLRILIRTARHLFSTGGR